MHEENRISPSPSPTQHLRIAAFEGDLNTVKVISSILPLSLLNVTNHSGNTALILAAMQGHVDVVNFLISKKVDLNIQTGFGAGYTALMYAVEKNYVEIVKALLDANADRYLKDFSGNSAFMLAQKGGNANMIKLLDTPAKKNYGAVASTFYYLSSPISSIIFSIVKSETKPIQQALTQNPEDLKAPLIAKQTN
jgi:ankyrin repeat protein